jgi:hypothetical protein
MLFDLYAKENKGLCMTSRDGRELVRLPMAAFANDTNLLGNDNFRELSIEELIEQAQKSFTTWNKLLHATGHFMELEKCSCYLMLWDFQDDGFAFTIPPEDLKHDIVVQDLARNPMTIKLLASECLQKLLGVMRNPIGNQQDEIE